MFRGFYYRCKELYQLSNIIVLLSIVNYQLSIKDRISFSITSIFVVGS